MYILSDFDLGHPDHVSIPAKQWSQIPSQLRRKIRTIEKKGEGDLIGVYEQARRYVDFSVSDFIPKIIENKKIRDSAAKLLKEGRAFAKKNKLNLMEHDMAHVIPKVVTERDPSILGEVKKGVPRKMSYTSISPLGEAKIYYQDVLIRPTETPLYRSDHKARARGYLAQYLDIPLDKRGRYKDNYGKIMPITGNKQELTKKLEVNENQKKKALNQLSSKELIRIAKKQPIEKVESEGLGQLVNLKMTKTRKRGLDAADSFNQKISKYLLSNDGYDLIQARDAIAKEGNRYGKEKGLDTARLRGKYK